MAEYVKLEESTPGKTKFYNIGKYSFSTIEIKHLVIALSLITLTFLAVSLRGTSRFSQMGIFEIVAAVLITVGTGFIIHEFAHKIVAQYYGFTSEFRGDFPMMFLSLAVATLTGFIFLAPGAVMILGRVSIRQNGIISVAGPITNLVLALIFLAMSLVFTTGFLSMVSQLGLWINALLGVFNMLPFWVLDGKKVIAWSRTAYFVVMIPLIILLIIGFGGF